MDLKDIPLFNAVKKRLNWLTQRQEILSQNIANSDTPNYKPRDLKTIDFSKLVDSQSKSMKMKATRPGHLSENRASINAFNSEVTRRPYETEPAGNAVVLEEQMTKVSTTNINHQLTSELYKKHLQLFSLAIGKDR